MNYYNTLLFIGKCLSLSIHPEKALQVKQQIREEKIEWEQVVRVSSEQLVLPAFYLNLKKTSLLKELPFDLVDYLEFLTNLNRERNFQILKQINDISTLLNEHDVAPLYLKGTAHLLIGLYGDPAERMIGDIDFLVEEVEMQKVAQLLINKGYKPLVDYNPAIHSTAKHYPRLTHDNYPAAIEIHRQVLNPPNDKKFNAKQIISHKQRIVGDCEIYVPAINELIIHNTLNMQLNDKAYLHFSMGMRQMYDLLLISNKQDPKIVLKEFGQFTKLSNSYLAVTCIIMDSPNEIYFDNNRQLRSFIKCFNFFHKNPKFLYSLYKYIIFFSNRMTRYISLPVKAIFNKNERIGLWYRLSDLSWYGKHFSSYRNFFNSG